MRTRRRFHLVKNRRDQTSRIPRDLETSGSEATLLNQNDRQNLKPVGKPPLLTVLAKLKPLDEGFPSVDRRPADAVHI